MTNKELFYFAGKCLTLDEDPGFSREIISKIESDSIDWLKFSALCSDHLILPVIYLKFLSHGVVEYLPDEFSAYLHEIYELNLTRNTRILEQLLEITGILNKSDIYPVFLKGAAHLLDELYTNIGERILGDIDFLVPEKDYFLSAKLLENNGYSKYENEANYFEVDSLKHYPPLVKEGSAAYIEIHRLVTHKEMSWFNFGTIDQEKKEPKTLKGCYVLSDKHKIIHNFVHSQLHHRGHIYGIVSLRDIYDLYLLSKRSDLEEALVQIKSKQKAIAYFALTRKALGLDKRLYPGSTFSTWLFLKKHDLNLGSSVFYQTYRTIVYLSRRLFIGYIGQTIKSFYNKSIRKSLINRLSDPKWYKAHILYHIDFFKRKR